MKILLIATLLLTSLASFSETINIPVALRSTLINQITASSYHVCHMSNVYLFDIYKTTSNKTLVWNNVTNSPLLCVDYDKYSKCVINNPMKITGVQLAELCPSLTPEKIKPSDKKVENYLELHGIITGIFNSELDRYKAIHKKMEEKNKEQQSIMEAKEKLRQSHFDEAVANEKLKVALELAAGNLNLKNIENKKTPEEK
jgi:hypothetical protein